MLVNFPGSGINDIKLYHEHIVRQLELTGWHLESKQEGEGWSSIMATRGKQRGYVDVNTQATGPTSGHLKLVDI